MWTAGYVKLLLPPPAEPGELPLGFRIIDCPPKVAPPTLPIGYQNSSFLSDVGAAAIQSGDLMLLSRRHSFPILTAAAFRLRHPHHPTNQNGSGRDPHSKRKGGGEVPRSRRSL